MSIQASDVQGALVFAPKDCTGNSGAVGDTILQTSFIRTLLDRSLFPKLGCVHWFGTKWVIDSLFPYFREACVITHAWGGGEKELVGNCEYQVLAGQAQTGGLLKVCVFICTRDEKAIQKIRRDFVKMPCFLPKHLLDAQSQTHLSRQIHTCLDGFNMSVSDIPQPRIVVTEDEISDAHTAMGLQKLLANPNTIERVEGRHEYNLSIDRTFLLHPGLQHGLTDRRTWGVEKWKELVHILGEIGVVVVACDDRSTPEAKAEETAAKEIVMGRQTFNWRFVIKLSLKDLAVWACSSDVTIARDSGPMHVASAAVGPTGHARVLGLFSVMCPSTWKPLSENFKGLGQWPLPLDPYVMPAEVAIRATHWEETP